MYLSQMEIESISIVLQDGPVLPLNDSFPASALHFQLCLQSGFSLALASLWPRDALQPGSVVPVRLAWV